jgi:hypothetical protein
MRGFPGYLAALTLSTLQTGCASKAEDLYAWGGYEELVYVSLSRPDEFQLEDGIRALEQDQERAAVSGRGMPPGWYAHLGYLYARSGRLDAARAAFEQEKAQFPESRAFVDWLMRNTGQAPVAPEEVELPGASP